MPRGDNPNSRANLIKNQKQTPKQARERGALGGKKSGEIRRQLKSFKELDNEYTTDEERKKMLDMLKRRAMQGNLKAYELYRDSMGMKPTDRVEQTNIEVLVEFEGEDK